MGEILFLAHRIPFPPNRGDKIRSHHLLNALAQINPVHVATFAETAEDRACEDQLSTVSASHCLVDRTKPLALAGVEALLSKRPVSLAAFDSRKLRDWIAATLAARPIDTIVVFSGQMGQFVPPDFRGRVIVDLCDVDSAKFDAYAAGGQQVWINRREAELLSEEEARLVGLADATILISEQEARLLADRIDVNDEAQIRSVGNGIDASFFDPGKTQPHPELASGAAHFVFTGQMDYPPNVAAVSRFARSILPKVGGEIAAQFHIVGRAPSAQVLRLGQLPHVTVWGEVADVRPFIAAATAVVAPLTIARGVQNKVLEAMAMARPVVLTPEAATGIGAADGRHFLVRREDEAFADALAAIYKGEVDGAALGQAARTYVLNSMSWDAIYRTIAEIVDTSESKSDAA